MRKVNCCFCDFVGLSEKGIRVHMAHAHKVVLSLKKIVMPGRPPAKACKLCGMVHSEVSRPGWANRRRKLERPRARMYYASIPGDSGGKGFQISQARVPEGMTMLKGIMLWADKPGRFTLNMTDPETGHVRKYTFKVGPRTLTT